MKITDVEAIVLRRHDPVRDISDGTQDTLVVRIHTDAGLVGIGEVDSAPEVVKAAIEAPKSHLTCAGLRQLLLGEDPRDVGRLWEKLYRGSLYFGRRGVGIHALSGIDIALWDLCGKALGQPVHRLLGGAHRDRVRAYASTLMPETPAEAGREAERWAARGSPRSSWAGAASGGRSTPTSPSWRRPGARWATGSTLMFDIGLVWDAATAIRQVRRMERFEPYWIEEPLHARRPRGYRRLADAVDTRIASGEQSVTRWEFEQLLDEGRVDVIQPDIAHAGGLTETRRIAELARLRGVPCVPHAFKTGILKAATLHLLAALPEAPFLEFCVWDSPLAQDLVHPALLDRLRRHGRRAPGTRARHHARRGGAGALPGGLSMREVPRFDHERGLSMSATAIRGVVPIIPLPFREDESIDRDGLAALCDFAARQRVGAVCLPAYGSEFYKLSDDERLQAVRVAVETVGRPRPRHGPVEPRLGAPGRRAGPGQREGRRLRRLGGAPAELRLRRGRPPRLRPDGGAGGRACRSSSRTGTPAAPPSARSSARASATPARTSATSSSRSPAWGRKVRAIRARCGDAVGVLEGWGGEYMLELLPAGIVGVMPGLALIDVLQRVWDLARAGRAAEAYEHFARIHPWIAYSLQSMESLQLPGEGPADPPWAPPRLPPAAPPDAARPGHHGLRRRS